MPSPDRIAALKPVVSEWRRDIHRHPEMLYDVHRTAGLVAEKLKSFGVDEVVTGLGKTGVVGVVRGRKQQSGKVVGLRADMDALPIDELTNLPHRSQNPGIMHACGHDGHTAMLLGAAKYLAETRDFDGTAVLIFQPAEEGGAGGKAMVNDGLMERFQIGEVYGMHNMPGIPIGEFALTPGPMMAAADRFDVTIEGRGGHAAYPHQTIDTVLASAHVITALQSIVSRNVNPLDSAVVSVTAIHAGEAFNVLPQSVSLRGTVRTLTPKMRAYVEKRFHEIVEATAKAFGATATIAYSLGYPVTQNHPAQTEFATAVARRVAGAKGVEAAMRPSMGAEDFSFMLEARPGAFIFVGNGDSAGLHHPAYDFNDDAIPHGIGYWATLVETAMPAG
jgi:hippurate hydrolase